MNRDTSSAWHPGGAIHISHGFLAAIVAAAYTGFSPAFVPFSLQQRTTSQHMLRGRLHLPISAMGPAKLQLSELLGDDSDSAGAAQAVSARCDHCLSVSLIVDATSSLNLASVTDSLLH